MRQIWGVLILCLIVSGLGCRRPSVKKIQTGSTHKGGSHPPPPNDVIHTKPVGAQGDSFYLMSVIPPQIKRDPSHGFSLEIQGLGEFVETIKVYYTLDAYENNQTPIASYAIPELPWSLCAHPHDFLAQSGNQPGSPITISSKLPSKPAIFGPFRDGVRPFEKVASHLTAGKPDSFTLQVFSTNTPSPYACADPVPTSCPTTIGAGTVCTIPCQRTCFLALDY